MPAAGDMLREPQSKKGPTSDRAASISFSSRRATTGVSAVAAVLLLVLAWRGLHLPYDFQIDPNLSHVLFGLHLADTQVFTNVFYPGFVNFMAEAIAIKIAGVPLASSAAFGLISIEKATFAARAAQFVITAGTVTAWLFAIRQWLLLIQRTRDQSTTGSAYPMTIVIAAMLLVFNYGTVYSAYFLRPDNALSAAIAVGLTICIAMFDRASAGVEVGPSWLVAFGAWVYMMTATKSQGQVLITAAIVFVLWMIHDRPAAFVTSTRARGFASLVVVIALVALVLRAHPSWGGLPLQSRVLCGAVVCLEVFAVALPSTWRANSFFQMYLYGVAGWGLVFLIVSIALPGQANVNNVLSISNPAYTIIEQLGINNVKLAWGPIAFILWHLSTYEAPILVLCVVGFFLRSRKAVAILTAIAAVMVVLVSLRLAGYYNLILVVPVLVAAASIALYDLFSGRYASHVPYVAIPPLILFSVMSMSLHQRHLDAYDTICILHGSLSTVSYEPDTIAVESSLASTNRIYFDSYAKPIFYLNYWPEIIARLKNDPETLAFLNGDSRTCR